ncbi:MAG: hypothetical protein IT426_09560 [Pirellulales bacterium]|nr:hypothetical protein [Pirellulales bacterium]
MIPDFDNHGYLPPGIHPATIEEIEERFGRQSEVRRSEFESLGWLIDLARKAKVIRLIINGSFVTDVLEPNDVDCTLLIENTARMDQPAILEILEGLPFLDVRVTQMIAFELMVNTIYATDRWQVPKGVIEVLL